MSNKPKRSPIRRFITSVLITVIVVLMVIGGVYAAYRVIIRPPALPEYEIIRVPTPPSSSRPVNNPVETESEPEIPDETEPIYEPEPEYEEIVFYRRPDFFTFLIYGIDDHGNADVVIVAAFDAVRNSAYIISIPRDTRVYTQRQNIRKISASYPLGRQGGRGHEGGMEQFKTEVSTLIGFRPDFYVGLNHRGFVRLIDSLGGVTVHVPFHMRYTATNGDVVVLDIDLQPGTQRLNGTQALHFVRFRQANYSYRSGTDFQRIQRGQAVINAALQELLSPRTITRIPELVSNSRANITTNLSADEIGWFIAQAPNLRSDDFLSSYTLPIARTERRGWYEMPDKEATLELVNRTINPFTRDITPEMLRIVE